MDASPSRSSNPFLTEANPDLASRLVPPKDSLADAPVPPDVAYQRSTDD
ncbi:hypothetical protein [Aeromicrobium sp. UC242_57]